MIAYEFTDEQGCAIAATAAAFGVSFREMAEHVIWFKVQSRIGRPPVAPTPESRGASVVPEGVFLGAKGWPV